ncbi:MAG: c-type cytochrome [Chlorobi bacterium]|nr:c-type cytochrome [Chlorobiota bacterium]
MTAEKYHHTYFLLTLFIGITWMFFQGASAVAQGDYCQESPWKGKKVFKEKGCIQCHAVYGRGGDIGPDLGKKKFYGTYMQLASLMWNHLPRMFTVMENRKRPFPKLTEKDMNKLLAYLAFIRYVGEPGNEHRGVKLLRSKRCIVCHQFGGEGGTIGPDLSKRKEYLSSLSMVRAMWNHGPQMQKIFRKQGIEPPEFSGTEIVDLTVAVRSYMSPSRVPSRAFNLGEPSKGRELLESKGCTRCHAVAGKGGTVGPDFTTVDFNYSVTQIAGKMWNHLPRMWEMMSSEKMAFPEFTEEEMADVISYLYALKLNDPPGDSKAGKKIVEQRNCLSCHSLRGTGSKDAPDLAKIGPLRNPVSLITKMWNHAPVMKKQLEKKSLRWPWLSGKEMTNVYAYLQSVAKKK